MKNFIKNKVALIVIACFLIIGLCFTLLVVGFTKRTKTEQVWLVEYSSLEVSDCNGVFTTREKAEKSLKEDFLACRDLWENIRLVAFDEEYLIIQFDVKDKPDLKNVTVALYPTKIQ